MNILFFIYSMEGGGAEKVCQLLINQFAGDEKNKVYLLLIDNTGIYLKKINNNIVVVSLPRIMQKLKIFNMLYYWMLLRCLKIDRVISFAEWPNFYSGIAKYLVGSNVKFIFTEHSTRSFINSPEIYKISRIIYQLAKISYKNADHIICCSKKVFAEVSKVVDSVNLSIIYNPVDLRSSRALSLLRADVDFPEDKINLVAVGRFHPSKDYITMLDAFELAFKTKSNLQLVILGDGEMRGIIEEKLNCLKSKFSIRLMGFVDNPFAYLSRADALLHSAIYEGFGNVFIESLAVGTPIITTDCDTPREIINDNLQGVIVPVGDVKKLANAILSQSKKTAEVSNSCKERAMYFDIESCYSQYKSIISRP